MSNQQSDESSDDLEIRPPTRRLRDIVLPPAPKNAIDSLAIVMELRQKDR